ncbi:DUF1351 domain-containing protein [Fusobacterium necrophorum]|uniref:DUF1351 domain-containing protein n=1 Tax=Fusobacterium necrophorum subsp. funduliforme TaxID=143387 RepID=A0A162IQN9_9FUSO|nr:DUF1351 domain-containing protein [Fusobacterium necrophorum]KYL03910.1 hypothetical protein A2J07_10920 [Fusobacterium necrophorum subsp. funduliforme]
MELKTTKNTPAIIEFNFNEIKTSLEEYSEKYVGLVVTEENIKEMTDAKNELGKIEKSIDSYRLEQKKEMEKPIKEFEAKCKELIEVVKKVSIPIREQLNSFEEKRKTEKEKEVKKIIEKIIEKFGLDETYAFQLTIVPKYLNKGQKEKDTIEELEQRAMLLKKSQEQEEQLKKMKEEKINLIEKTIQKNNEEFGVSLKIVDFLSLVDKEFSEILEHIEKTVKQELEKKNENNKKQESTPQLSKEKTKMKEKNSFIFTIRNISKKDFDKIQNFLSNEFYDFDFKKI